MESPPETIFADSFASLSEVSATTLALKVI